MARVGYGFQDTHDKATDEKVLNAPRHRLNVALQGTAVAGTEFGVSFRSESRRKTRYGIRTEAPVVLDLAVMSRPLADHLTIQAARMEANARVH